MKSSEKKKPHIVPCAPTVSYCLPQFVPFQYLTVNDNIIAMVFTGTAGVWDLSFFLFGIVMHGCKKCPRRKCVSEVVKEETKWFFLYFFMKFGKSI